MMQIVVHRRNQIEDLRSTPQDLGVEVDIRSWGDELILHHEPFVKGPALEEWIVEYRHRLLILNVKEEGLEARLLEIMRQRGIENFFFLDQSFPFLIRTTAAGERRSAVRVSEFESIETAHSLARLVDWVWVDCFTRLPISSDDARRLRDSGLRICLVSPELHGRSNDAIVEYRRLVESRGIVADAVCTKRPELWG